MQEEVKSIKKTSRSILTALIDTVLIGMTVSLIVSSIGVPRLNSNMLITFGSLIVLVVITVVVTTILKRGSSKVAILKDSLKEAYINAIDHSSLNPTFSMPASKMINQFNYNYDPDWRRP
jgi:hypothetical protein